MARGTTDRRLACAAFWAAILVLDPGPVWAHAFGERYDLPLPLTFYLGGAAVAVVASFVVVGLFVGEVPWLGRHRRVDLLAHPLGRIVAHPAAVFVLKCLSAALLVLVVAAGFFGSPDPFRNIAPVATWILFWIGLAFVSAFVGDLWAVINPWRTLFAWAETLWRRWRPGRELAPGLRCPAALGTWPAVALLFAFAWAELIFPYPGVPLYIAAMAAGYSLLTWTGMFLFGRERWLESGEVFSVVFGILARFAPTGVRTRRTAAGTREWTLRPFAVGLLGSEPAGGSTVALVLLYLASVIFDGILATPAWETFEAPLAAFAPAAPDAARMALRTLGLLGVWLAALGLYRLACRFMAALVAGFSESEIAGRFVLTLVPIAIGYHLAHYLGYFLIQGQYAIPLVSDPFGRGWDLFGTAAYRVDVAALGARFAWYAAVVAIVGGHVIAVLLAHAQAVAAFGTRRIAVRSQIPLTALMVAFTVASLSVMAEPIVRIAPAPETRAAEAGVTMPTDAVLPEPGSGRLLAVGPGRTAQTKLTYAVTASPFHDGSTVTAADLLYAFAFAYRWSAQGAAPGGRYDPGIDRATALLRRNLAGVRFVGPDKASRPVRFGDIVYAREQLLVEVYLGAPSGETAVATLAPPWSPLPWHAIALMEEAVARGFAAFSQAEAARLGVEWLDPVRSGVLKGRLAALVEEFARAGYVPEPLAGLVTSAEARARWKALAAFHAEHGHWLVTNGPYRIKSWSNDAALLEVVRDPRYPLGVGSYDSYAIPRRAFATAVDAVADGIALSVEIETVEKFGRDYRIVRQPLKAARAVGERIDPECRYVAVTEDGKVALAGQGRFRDDGSVVLDLRGKLAPGRYTVLAALILNGNAANAEIRRIPFEAR
jgi:hypothetical protein